jgi:hypothetical protein
MLTYADVCGEKTRHAAVAGVYGIC